MLIAAWLYTVGALAIVLASGTALLGASRRWWKLVLALTACIAVQILVVNTTAWSASQHLSIRLFVGAAVAYPIGLLVLGGVAFVARRMQQARRVYLCAGLAVPIFVSSTIAGMLMGCAADLDCMRTYSELL